MALGAANRMKGTADANTKAADERMAAQLEIEVRTLRRWRREAKVAGLISIGASSWSIAYR
jgi:hypothetical protein